MHKEEITELFRRLLQQTGAVDIAEAEFKRMIGEDESLRNEYREWCHMVGSSERKGDPVKQRCLLQNHHFHAVLRPVRKIREQAFLEKLQKSGGQALPARPAQGRYKKVGNQ